MKQPAVSVVLSIKWAESVILMVTAHFFYFKALFE